MDVLNNLNVVIISQGIHILNYHVVHFVEIQFLFINYASIKLDILN